MHVLVGIALTKTRNACVYIYISLYMYEYSEVHIFKMHAGSPLYFQCHHPESTLIKTVFLLLLPLPLIPPKQSVSLYYLFPYSPTTPFFASTSFSFLHLLLSLFLLFPPPFAFTRLRSVKMEQRKLNDQANTLVDLAKVSLLSDVTF